MIAVLNSEISALQTLPGSAFELRKLILKLRWIGAEEEAYCLTRIMNDRWPVTPPFVGPFDTD